MVQREALSAPEKGKTAYVRYTVKVRIIVDIVNYPVDNRFCENAPAPVGAGSGIFSAGAHKHNVLSTA